MKSLQVALKETKTKSKKFSQTEFVTEDGEVGAGGGGVAEKRILSREVGEIETERDGGGDWGGGGEVEGRWGQPTAVASSAIRPNVYSVMNFWVTQSSWAVWKSRRQSWAPVPNSPYGLCGRKATLQPAILGHTKDESEMYKNTLMNH